MKQVFNKIKIFIDTFGQRLLGVQPVAKPSTNLVPTETVLPVPEKLIKPVTPSISHELEVHLIEENNMSIFSAIVKAEHSTVAWLEKELTVFEKKAPAIAKVIDAGLSYINPVLQIALDALGKSEDAAIVGNVVSEAQKDLAVASATVTDFGPTPTAATIFGSVQANLSNLLTAGHVTNSTSVSAVNKVVNEVGVLGAAVSEAAAGITAAVNASTSNVA